MNVLFGGYGNVIDDPMFREIKGGKGKRGDLRNIGHEGKRITCFEKIEV